MNKSTSNYIDQLLIDSGLFPELSKPQKPLNNFDFSEETILITGAAGSIGSELSRQLVKSNFKKLILLDVAESPLYQLIKDFEFEVTDNIDFIILNITEKESIKHIFETYKPSLVIHTAAYKHVPLMEDNPYEAVTINILGTKLLADLSIAYGVKKFVFISTDKAVNPISVMGMSKHIAENYLNYLSTKSDTLFLTTRFGNILGSNGSVLLLFKKQIKTSNSITVTHRAVSRYFISKQKAGNLILKIASFSNVESSIFTFNMGEPIRIIHLAKRLLLLYKTSGKNVEIKITELRPGEKLHEDIVSNNETLIPTQVKDILQVKKKNNSEIKKIDFTELLNITPYLSKTEIKLILTSYI
jgi:FlaA1/EpsC-like NDP-sugar epimerase